MHNKMRFNILKCDKKETIEKCYGIQFKYFKCIKSVKIIKYVW